MFINEVPPGAYADLGDVWLRDQLARLRQRHQQFGRHFRMNVEALLARNAHAARVGVPICEAERHLNVVDQ